MSDFLNLPPELRLEVYRILIEDCLWEGQVSDLSGLYKCCREVYKELEAEYIAKIRPVLYTKSLWEATSSQQGPLRMKISPSLTAKPGEGDLSIILPFDNRRKRRHSQIYAAFNTLATCLSPVFAAPWETITISPNKLVSPEYSAQTSKVFLELGVVFVLLIYEYDLVRGDILCDIPRTRHLRLQYGGNTEHLSLHMFHRLWEVSCCYRQAFLGNGSMPRGAKSFISKMSQGDEQGWQLVFDFEDNSAAEKGAHWEVWNDDFSWRIRRLFNDTEVYPFTVEDEEALAKPEDFFAATEIDDDTDSDEDEASE
ncbi:hypothetical protein FB567DRAFT_606768 [Paraphoma chrysanthemicola]|uniref:Uncharacterized protein n=1 Tax=Paraphoma chrysanthemicola TaxID=798071 RepID=A0A8K0R194_9PLEO|nr:hypothetical protein FB567DRAFT_606768 [Paraphoma chrysanthemicola]